MPALPRAPTDRIARDNPAILKAAAPPDLLSGLILGTRSMGLGVVEGITGVWVRLEKGHLDVRWSRWPCVWDCHAGYAFGMATLAMWLGWPRWPCGWDGHAGHAFGGSKGRSTGIKAWGDRRVGRAALFKMAAHVLDCLHMLMTPVDSKSLITRTHNTRAQRARTQTTSRLRR